MAYPMMKKDARERYEKWRKLIENVIGLPIDLSGKVDTFHRSFYFENRGKMTIKQSGDGVFFFVSDDKLKKDIYEKVYGTNPIKSDREFVFDEKSLDRYLDIIGFEPKMDREYRIDQIPSSRFMTSKEINKEIDKLYG